MCLPKSDRSYLSASNLTKYHCTTKLKLTKVLYRSLRATKTLEVLIFIFSKTKFFLMSSLKFALSDVTLFLPDNLSELKKSYSGLERCLKLPYHSSVAQVTLLHQLKTELH